MIERRRSAEAVALPNAPLSLALRAPEKIFVQDVSAAGGGVLLHLEIRNRAVTPWEARTPNGPLLEVIVLDSKGNEKSRQTRQMKMLSPPTRLDPGRGFLLPLRVVFPELAPEGEAFTLRFRFAPGAEETEATLRLEPRA